LLDKLEIFVRADVRSARTRKDDYGQLTKDRVDGGTAEPELAEMRAG
jgi:hypothetical protein